MDVVDLEGFIQNLWQEWAVEIGAAVLAHVIYESAGLEPVSWPTDFIAFENLELGL